MATTKAQEIIYKISEILYRNGKYGFERIAIICEMISKLMSPNWRKYNNTKPDRQSLDKLLDKMSYNMKVNSFLLERDEKQINLLLTALIQEEKNDIANAIKQLVENDKKSSNIIPTDDFSVKIMQSFAKKMYKGGTYIDPCVGTGRLLAGLGADKYYGFDIDGNAVKISETYLNLIEQNSNRTSPDINISHENFLYRKFGLIDNIYNPTYIFDPPLNDSIEMSPLLEISLNKAGIYSWGKNIPSEYAFLTKVLFEANTDVCNFVCIVSNSFLSATDKFKSSFRKYLMEHSLIAVIQSNFAEGNNVQKLILAGKSHLDNSQDSLRYFITPKDKSISEEDIYKIVQKCLNNETFEEKEFYNIAKVKAYSLKEILENDSQISMPQYYEDEINPNEIKSMEEIEDYIRNSMSELCETNQRLELLIRNLNQGIKQSYDLEQAKDFVNVLSPWFIDGESDIAISTREFVGVEQAWTKLNYEIYLSELIEKIKKMKILFSKNRLRINDKKIEIYSQKNMPRYKNKKSFSDYIIGYNKNNAYLQKMFNNLSKKQIDIFNGFIKLHFDDGNIFNKFATSEVHSAIATFKVLGLLYSLPNVDDELERYFPYTPILNIREGD